MEPRYLVYQGFLRKSPPEKKMETDRWQKRYFKLWNDSMLEYYTNNTDKKPRRCPIDLTQCREVCDAKEQYKKYYKGKKERWAFCVSMPDRLYVLLAYSEEERATWKEKICELCSSLHMENTSNRVQHVPVTNSSKYSPDTLNTSLGGNETRLQTLPISIPSSMNSTTGSIDDRSNDSWEDESSFTNYSQPPPPRIADIFSNSPDGSLATIDTVISDEGLIRNDSDVFTNAYDVPPSNNDLVYLNNDNYDVPPSNELYDIPPSNRNYNENYNVPPLNTNYDVPPSNEGYDLLPPLNRSYDVPPSNEGYDVLPPLNRSYDVPPSNELYDVPPSNRSFNASSSNKRYGSSVSESKKAYNKPPNINTLPCSSQRMKQVCTRISNTNEIGYVKMDPPDTNEDYIAMEPQELMGEEYVHMGPDEYIEYVNSQPSVNQFSPKPSVKEFKSIVGSLDRFRIQSTKDEAPLSPKLNTTGRTTTKVQSECIPEEASKISSKSSKIQENIAAPPEVNRSAKPGPTIDRATKPKKCSGDSNSSQKSSSTSTGYFNFSPHEYEETFHNTCDLYTNDEISSTGGKRLQTEQYETHQPYWARNDQTNPLTCDRTDYYRDTNNNQHKDYDEYEYKDLPPPPVFNDNEITDDQYVSPPSNPKSIYNYEKFQAGYEYFDNGEENYQNVSDVTQECPDSPDSLSYVQLATQLSGNVNFSPVAAPPSNDGYVMVDAMKSAAAKDLR